MDDDSSMSQILTEVASEEDRQLLMDVLQAIKVCRDPDTLCTSWTVTPNSTGYTLVAYLPRAADARGGGGQQQIVEVTHDDINLIESVNMLRVRVGVAQFPQGTWGLKIHITGHASPVSFVSYDTTRFSVRRAMVAGGGRGRTAPGWLGRTVQSWVAGKPAASSGEGAPAAKRKRGLVGM